MIVASLLARLGLTVDSGSFARGTSAIQSVSLQVTRLQTAAARALGSGLKRLASGLAGVRHEADKAGKGIRDTDSSLRGLGVTLLAYVGIAKAKGALIGFNSTMEDTRNQIAGMMALATKTNLADQYETADKVLANLQRRAAKLPGTTLEYAKMLGMITQPALSAKLSVQDLEDVTVSAVVAAKAFGIASDVAARDIDQALRGQYKSVDVLTGKLLGSIGYAGEAGRSKFNALDPTKRGSVLKEALTQKQVAQLAAAQGNTFSGVMSTLQDTIQRFFGAVGIDLFRSIGDQIRSWNKWIELNDDAIKSFAATTADILSVAFDAVALAASGVASVIGLISESKEVSYPILMTIATAFLAIAGAATIAWIAAAWPLIELMAGVFLLYQTLMLVWKAVIDGEGVFADLYRTARDAIRGAVGAARDGFNGIGRFFRSIGDSIIGAWNAVWDFLAVKVKWVEDKYNTVKNFVLNADDADISAVNSAAAAAGAAPVLAAPLVRSPGAAPVVMVDATMQMRIDAGGDPEQVKKIANDAVEAHHQRTWSAVDHALGEE